jgi:1-acyl-sn-glycerol-3-phosphate acyltransferase
MPGEIMEAKFAIQYPRKVFIRHFLRFLGRLLLPLLARVTVTGRENFPRKGPVILAGNHVAFLEVALMVVYPPYLVELIGTGDIPLDPTFAPLAHLYGFIPVNRGNLDRNGLQQALAILKQGGVLGIFPEGGIWQPDAMQAQTGVAWLSSQSQAPVVPIGFGGMRGAIAAMLRLQRPRLSMTIGEAIPPIEIEQKTISRKAALVQGSQVIMEHIQALIPAEEQRRRTAYTNSRYALEINLVGEEGSQVLLPAEHTIKQAEALAQFLMQPVLLDVFVHNLNLSKVRPLQNLNQPYPALEIHQAVQAVLDYLETNRGFFTYRFGMETGLAIKSGLEELLELSGWAAQSDHLLHLIPIHCYTNNAGEEIQERGSRQVESR